MLDEYKLGQPIAYKILLNAVKKEKLTHAYLFETHGYHDALNLIKAFIKFILCPENYSNNQLCAKCTQCQNIDNNNHLELKIIEPDGMWIKKEQLTELQKEFSKKAIEGNKKVYLIKDADKLNQAAANSILKFLEEPEENIIAILMVENKYQLLDTITSRCQIISLMNQKYDNILSAEEKIQNIINSSDFKWEKIEQVIHFVNYYEQNGIDTILNTQKLWHKNFINKEDIEQALEVMILYYTDIINFLSGYKISLFETSKKDINAIAEKNNLGSLSIKINTILEAKENLKYNVNNGLLIDKLILDLEEVKDDRSNRSNI